MAAPEPLAISPLDTVVELRQVSKTYYQKQRSASLRDVVRNLLWPQIRAVEALRQVDLQIQRGQIVAYAGPNGAGKSTTVKILSGLLTADSGQVRVLGLDPAQQRRQFVGRIGVVFGQRTELWWDQPVAASYEWKRVVWDIPDKRYRVMLDFVRQLLGLDEFFQSLARQLSLGQRMRADLGMALLHEPEILFLDEPTIGVDVLAKRRMLDFIKDLNRQRQVTVVLTSHDMAELEQLAGRMVLIDRGRIAFDGDFAQLRAQYAARRHLLVQTESDQPPVLPGAEWVKSQERRHEYLYDAGQVDIAALLAAVQEQTVIVDVETQRADIDEVIADIYQQWRH
ncbi:MAG: ATP-binding cassette domain-containing protein [Candidatus Latescibacteria bacterium]|nr:ATP-binding cassette domain-containing protein [Candidatus Latescibacterota bacterium]